METIDDKAVVKTKASETTEVDIVETTDGKAVVKTKASETTEEATIAVDNVETTGEATTAEDNVVRTDGKGVVISEISGTNVGGIASPA